MDNKLSIEAEAEINRHVGSVMRRLVEAKDPELYRQLAEQDPLLYGPDSLDRIKWEFPQFFPEPGSPTGTKLGTDTREKRCSGQEVT